MLEVSSFIAVVVEIHKNLKEEKKTRKTFSKSKTCVFYNVTFKIFFSLTNLLIHYFSFTMNQNKTSPPLIITIDGCHYVLKNEFNLKIDSNSTVYRNIVAAFFGVKTDVMVALWNEMVVQGHVGDKHKFKHLLWAFNFLKVYNTYLVMSTTVGTAPNTYKKWVWLTLCCLCKIKIVSFFLLNLYMFIY